MQVILASGNRGKYKEMRAALKEIGIDLLFGGDFASPVNVEETGSTYAENAELKARAWAKACKCASIADDSGLEVAALNNAPGIHSARIVKGSDSDRIKWLLENIKDKDDKRARFACAIVFVPSADGKALSVLEYCNGKITDTPSGDSGFGYDPVFVPDGYDKTFAELGEEIKNKISHRGKAIKSIAEKLNNMIE